MKKILLIAMTLIAGLAGTFVAVTPAAAAESDCSPGQMCIWTSYNATGTRFQTFPQLDHCVDMSPASVDNNSEWGYNRSTHNIYTYTGYQGAGTSSLWRPGDHGPVSTAMYNNISSVCRWS